MGVAVVQLAPGIADADDRLVLKEIGREALRAHPGAPGEALVVGLAPPLLAAQLSTVTCSHGKTLHREPRGRVQYAILSRMIFARLALGAVVLQTTLPLAQPALFRRA